ncbi:MAG TPA: hypothetical protein VHZ24_05735 [Pirellulales bacterium]|jgi:hypothetical protein|nr:hypothetical protein [Pirellulales bacterium]
MPSPSVFFVVDDKYVPLYRVMWISATPHFCGEEDCEREGYYEVRLEQGESVWAKTDERDNLIAAVEDWANGDPPEEEGEEDGGTWK